MCGWRNRYKSGSPPWIIFCQLNLGVVASECLPHSPFGATGPLGLYDVGYTLGLRLHLHWAALELLVEYRPGIEITAWWLFGMCLAVLLSQGDHTFLCLVLIGWMTCFLQFCEWACHRQLPHIFLSSWRGICCKYHQVWKSLLLFFTKFGVLWFIRILMAGSYRGSDRVFQTSCFPLPHGLRAFYFLVGFEFIWFFGT